MKKLHRLEIKITNRGVETRLVCPDAPGICGCQDLPTAYDGWGPNGTALGNIPVDLAIDASGKRLVGPLVLPPWRELAPADQGAAVEYFTAWAADGLFRAREEFPCQFLIDPRLTSLTPTEACAYAEALAAEVSEATADAGNGGDYALRALGVVAQYDLIRAAVEHRFEQRQAKEQEEVPCG